MNSKPRVVGEFVDYQQMLDCLRARVTELQIAGDAFDDYVGLPRGYFAKIVGINPIRRVGMCSLGPILLGLGLRCQFVEDAQMTKQLKKRVAPRNSSFVRADRLHQIIFTGRKLQKIRRLGGTARMAQLTPAERSELARKAALARWHGRNGSG